MLASLVNQARKWRGRAYLVLCLGLVLYLALTAAVPPILSRSETMREQLIQTARLIFWSAASPASADAAWLNLMGFGFILPIGLSAVGVLHARDWIIANRGENQLTLLLSYPTSRPQMLGGILLIQFGSILGLAVLSALILSIGSLIAGTDEMIPRLPAMAAISTLFCLVFSFVTMLAGNLTGKSWAALGAGGAALLLSAVIYLLPGFTSLPAWLRWLSPMAAYLEGNPLLNGLQAVNWLGTAGWTLAAGAAVWLNFVHLDLGN